MEALGVPERGDQAAIRRWSTSRDGSALAARATKNLVTLYVVNVPISDASMPMIGQFNSCKRLHGRDPARYGMRNRTSSNT